jgi:hypothetical protein
MIKLHLSFALHEVLSFLIFANPLASDVASRHAETHQVSCIIKKVQFMTSFWEESRSSTFKLMFLSL